MVVSRDAADIFQFFQRLFLVSYPSAEVKNAACFAVDLDGIDRLGHAEGTGAREGAPVKQSAFVGVMLAADTGIEARGRLLCQNAESGAMDIALVRKRDRRKAENAGNVLNTKVVVE